MMRPARCSHHRAQRLLNAQMRAGEIRAQHGVPVVGFHAHGEPVARDGGVVDENIEPAEFLEDLLESGFHLLGVGNVHLYGQSRAARAFDFCNQRRKLFGASAPRRRPSRRPRPAPARCRGRFLETHR